jgi:hypothetical protein
VRWAVKPYKTPRLKVITNGFGIQTTLNYKPLTDSSVYTKGPKKGYYPNIVIQNARVISLNVFFGCSDMSSIGISLTIFSTGEFIGLKVFFKERSYDFNASGNSPLITVVTSQSNIDNYGNVGTIRISTTGNNKIFSKVTKNTCLNVFFGCSDMSSIGISLTIFSTGEFIGLKVFFLNPTKA